MIQNLSNDLLIITPDSSPERSSSPRKSEKLKNDTNNISQMNLLIPSQNLSPISEQKQYHLLPNSFSKGGKNFSKPLNILRKSSFCEGLLMGVNLLNGESNNASSSTTETIQNLYNNRRRSSSLCGQLLKADCQVCFFFKFIILKDKFLRLKLYQKYFFL